MEVNTESELIKLRDENAILKQLIWEARVPVELWDIQTNKDAPWREKWLAIAGKLYPERYLELKNPRQDQVEARSKGLIAMFFNRRKTT